MKSSQNKHHYVKKIGKNELVNTKNNRNTQNREIGGKPSSAIMKNYYQLMQIAHATLDQLLR